MTAAFIHRLLRPGRFFVLAVVVFFLAFSPVARLAAQDSNDLDYVTHISLDFQHYSVLPSNIALNYTDANGNQQPAPAPGSTGFFAPAADPNLSVMFFFTQRSIYFFAYDATMTSANPEPVTWFPNGIPFEGDLTIGPNALVSFVQIPTPVLNPRFPTTGPAYLNTQGAEITLTRNSLFEYDLYQRGRIQTNSLALPSDGPLYLPPTALVSTGYNTSIIASAGGIYLQNYNNRVTPEILTPLVTAQGSGPGELSNPTALCIGPDGLLYVLDSGNNRIESFNATTGAFHSQFSLGGVTVLSNSLAISANGHIYLGDGLGGGSVFDLQGNLIGTFHPPTPDSSWVDGGLFPGSPSGTQSFLEYDGMGNVFTYVEGEGLMVYKDPTFQFVPEPSTWILLVLGAGGLFTARRKFAISRQS